MKKLYYLGPEGTYSETAALKIKSFIPKDYILTPVSTIAKVIHIVNEDEQSIGVLPIENLVEGVVRQTLDNIYEYDVKIQASLDLEICHCLVSKSNSIGDIRHIISHPQALAQSQKFILNNFDNNIEIESVNSTALAGFSLLERDTTYSAIISKELANKLGLNILGKNIGDVKENITRFIVISKKKINFGIKQKTSIVFNTKNEPGALLKILEIFNNNKINLVYLESRPSKEVLGEYNFFADIDKGIDEIKTVLDEIAWKCNFYKLLGSYTIL